MSEAISNIWRRPLRTALTILGIVIGVFALTVMGALAEKLNVLVDGGDEYFRTRIFVFDEGAASGFQASSRPITGSSPSAGTSRTRSSTADRTARPRRSGPDWAPCGERSSNR